MCLAWPMSIWTLLACAAWGSGAQYDYNSLGDYCKLTERQSECGYPESQMSTGCSKLCKYNKGVTEVTTNLQAFRKYQLDYHNDKRQHLASGNEKNLSTGSASNMNVLNWDLELEHLVRCWLVNEKWGVAGEAYHDKCSRSFKNGGNRATQNIFLSTGEETVNSVDSFYRSVGMWYDEVIYVKDSTILNLTFDDPKKEGQNVGHFTAMVWAKASHVGCARGFHLGGEEDQYGTTCHYAGWLGGKYQFVNMFNHKVYEPGPPCSKCPPGIKCNDKYKALCGKLDPIPTDTFMPLYGDPAWDKEKPPGGGGGGGGGGGSDKDKKKEEGGASTENTNSTAVSITASPVTTIATSIVLFNLPLRLLP